MSALDTLRDRPLPGQRFGQGHSIRSADVARLKRELSAALDSIAALCETEGLELGPTGFPIDVKHLKRLARGPAGNNARQIERDCALATALRQEISARATSKAAHRKRESGGARKHLQKLLSDAPALEYEAHETAARVASSWQLVKQFTDALQDVAGSGSLVQQHEMFRAAVQRAAGALEIAAPETAPLPDSLPGQKDVRAALDALQGRGGYSRLKINTGQAGRVDKLVAKLKSAD